MNMKKIMLLALVMVSDGAQAGWRDSFNNAWDKVAQNVSARGAAEVVGVMALVAGFYALRQSSKQFDDLLKVNRLNCDSFEKQKRAKELVQYKLERAEEETLSLRKLLSLNNKTISVKNTEIQRLRDETSNFGKNALSKEQEVARLQGELESLRSQVTANRLSNMHNLDLSFNMDHSIDLEGVSTESYLQHSSVTNGSYLFASFRPLNVVDPELSANSHLYALISAPSPIEQRSRSSSYSDSE